MSGLATKNGFEPRLDPNGTWSVFDTLSGMPATRSIVPICNLSQVKATDIARAMNRAPSNSPSRLHRYAIQGLPPIQ